MTTMRRRYFFFNDTATTEIYTLSLHDALPILRINSVRYFLNLMIDGQPAFLISREGCPILVKGLDRKSTRLNSSHMSISYAVFCLKKKTKKKYRIRKRKNNDNKTKTHKKIYMK